MATRDTKTEARSKALMESLIHAFEARMKREEKLKYQLLPVVAEEIMTSTRSLEHWLSRTGPKPHSQITINAIENWVAEEQEKRG